ncbi:DUF2911 domain-containing protein [Runella sp.]|uniref:DUF2911 domain-containing protein n=1 Tax=Runella sp. TaxID=1960881 RepID=UPI003D0D83D6
MKKILKWTGIVIGVLAVVLFITFKFIQYNTKKASPEATAEYKKDGTEISVFYCRPSKKGRVIFGGLEPYGKVWRTGANEATTFTTNKDLTIDGKTLPAGKYTLWTIPGKEKWMVIFNGKMYGWGVDLNQKASREADADVLQVEIPVESLSNVQEQFLISFDEATPAMVLAWDMTKITVPFK